MRILIVGGGPAGLTLANSLDAKKHDVTIIEKEKEWKTMGYGIFFLYEGRHIAEKIVGTKALNAVSQRLKVGHYMDRSGELLFLQDYNHLYHVPDGHSITSIRREDLHHLLLTKLPKRVHLKMGTTTKSLVQETDAVTVQLSDGTAETFDLVVGADGMHSPLREQYFSYEVKHLPWQARYYWFPDESTEFQAVISTSVALMHMPIKNGKTVALSIEHESLGQGAEGVENGVRFLEGYYAKQHIPKEVIAKSLREAHISPMRYIYTREWYKGRIVLIGDAKHCMTPTMGYGTMLALEDASELARVLNTALPHPAREDLEKMLARFASLRDRRVRHLRMTNRLIESVLLRHSRFYFATLRRCRFLTQIMVDVCNWLSRLVLRFG